MIEIKDLLSGLRDKLFSEEIKKDEVRRIISREINLDIPSSCVEIKNGSVFLNIKPIYKNELFLKREVILQKLEQSLGHKSPKEVK